MAASAGDASAMVGGAPQFASLYVGDLSPGVTEAMLYEIFNSVGPVASIRVCRDNQTRRSLGYGYVNYHNVSDAERALETLNYSNIKGRSCRIMWSQRDPSLRRSGAGNIYVRNLDRSIDNKALYDTFSLFGSILSCKVASDMTGKSHGYGFVHYETEASAQQAIERVNGMQIGEKTVQVCAFVKRSDRDKPDTESYTNLYVKNLPAGWDEAKIAEVFSEFGPVTHTAVRTDAKGREFAFVNFERGEDAKKSVEALHRKDFRTPEEIEKADREKEEEEQAEKVEEDDPDAHPAHLLYVQRAQSKAERQAALREKFLASSEGKPEGVNLYVKNLDEKTDEAELRRLFEPFGAIRSVAVPKDENGRCKGFGFVYFLSPDEATKAVTEMHLKVINGKPLYVGLAEKREARRERLQQRYDPMALTAGWKGKGGGKDAKGGGGGFGWGPEGGGPTSGGMPFQPAYGYGGGASQAMMPRPQGPMMMGPRGPMMGSPQMMAMMGKGGTMIGNPQMMPMMGQVNPQMMGMMQKGGMPAMMPMGAMMRPATPQQMQAMQKGGGPAMPAQQLAPQPQQPRPPPATAQGGGGGAQLPPPLTAAALAAAPPATQKQMIGERLFGSISKHQPELAGKITGMMLEMDNSELLMLLESEQQLMAKVDEALRVLSTMK